MFNVSGKYSFGLGKRDKTFSFGLGKRYNYFLVDDDDDDNDSNDAESNETKNKLDGNENEDNENVNNNVNTNTKNHIFNNSNRMDNENINESEYSDINDEKRRGDKYGEKQKFSFGLGKRSNRFDNMIKANDAEDLSEKHIRSLHYNYGFDKRNIQQP